MNRTSTPRILVAGIGNIFFGDDAFGCEVARQLSNREVPENVKVVDFGIRSFDLAYALLDGYDLNVLVDATQRGGDPGTLYTLELEVDGDSETSETAWEAHGLNLMKVLGLVKAMGGKPNRILMVGCEPAALGSEEEVLMGLSDPVQAAVRDAVGLVESLVADFLDPIISIGKIQTTPQQ